VSRPDASGGPAGSEPAGGRQEPVHAAPWKPRAAADFRAEDVAQCGQGVLIDLGNYEPSAGEEFEVGLRLTGPALESLTLQLRYDKDYLALVPGSVHPAGPQFRSGIECYAGRDGGTMILIHTGEPGKKNLDAGSGEVAVVWRMKAVQAGGTRVEVSERSSFTSAEGEDETFRVVGGEVSVR
jgi:hypothetical protein